MNLKPLFEMQRKLDSNILWKHPEVKEENLLQQKILACIVELGELANEWRGFKFWSVNRKPSNRIKEEFTDVLHFVLSIGLELGYEVDNVSLFDSEPSKDIKDHFLLLQNAISFIGLRIKKIQDYQYKSILIFTLQLGIELGLSPDDIIEGYYEKNKINFKRQEEGY